MFPLDLVLVSNLMKWILRKFYYKTFTVKYSPIQYDADDCRLFRKDVYYTGTVTEMVDDVAFIDGKYTFGVSQISKDVFVGSVVTCVLNSDKSGVLSDLTVIDIVSDGVELDDPPSNAKTHGVVIKRVDRLFTVSPGPLEFDLDDVSTKFIPEVGDMIDLYIDKKDGSGNKVINIFPRGYRIVTGTVTSFENDCGFVNDNIVFQIHHCQPGFQPVKDDRVVLSVIRCQNGSTRYRALHLSPLNNSKFNKPSTYLIPNESFFSNVAFYPKEVICVFLDEIKEIHAEIHNNSNSNYKLLQLKAYTAESQIELLIPENIVMTLKPKSKTSLKFSVCVKYFGFSTIIFDFIFEKFIFNCSLNLLAISKENDFSLSSLHLKDRETANEQKQKVHSSVTKSRSDFPLKAPIPGRRFKTPIKFFPVKLGFYEIPHQIIDIFKDGTKGHLIRSELENYSPSLKAGLNSDNYKIYLHCLLYVEEVAHLERVSKLELTTGFERRNDFLVLMIEEGTNFTILQAGDKVLARKPWDTEGDIYEGIIWNTQPRELHVKFGRSFHDNYVIRSEYILTFSVSRSQIRLKHQAIEDAVLNLGLRWLFPNQVGFLPPFVEQVFNESDETGPRTSANCQRNTKWNRQGSGYGNRQQKFVIDNFIPLQRKRVIKWYNGDLNFEQKHAIINCLGGQIRPFPYVLFGPPGTGKSMTLVELCLQIYNLIPESRILLVAPSNSAADQLSVNLIGSGFVNDHDFVRLGGFRYIGGGSVPEGLKEYVKLPIMNEEEEDNDELPKISRYALSEKRIIVSTLGSIGTLRTMGFPSGYFTHYIVDEAGQVMEPENLIVAGLMSKDSCMILAGDPLQLGPVVLSSISKFYKLNQSFLKRIMEFKPYMFDKVGFPNSYGYNPKFITKLVRSYRALPKLLRLTSKLFYRDELKSMVDELLSREAAIYLKIKELFPADSEVPVLFHSVSGKEVLEDGSFSFYNNEEVFQICTYLSQLYRLGIHSHEVGIITPYIAQVRKMHKFLETLSLEIPKIGSVEEFQGQERDIILLSTVRSSLIVDPNLSQMSFIYSPERINVATSRAKAALIIVGNSITLSSDEIWKNIVKYAIDNKSFRR